MAKPAKVTLIADLEHDEQSQAERALLTRLAQGEQEIAHGEGYDLEDVLNEADSLLLRPPE
jgi:hypothetical protein